MATSAAVQTHPTHVRAVLVKGTKTTNLSPRAEERQHEMFDLRRENTRLLYCVARLLGGTEKEQRAAIDDMIELCSDPIMARRVVRVLDGSPERLRVSLADLYQRAKRASSPS